MVLFESTATSTAEPHRSALAPTRAPTFFHPCRLGKAVPTLLSPMSDPANMGLRLAELCSALRVLVVVTKQLRAAAAAFGASRFFIEQARALNSMERQNLFGEASSVSNALYKLHTSGTL